MTNKNAVTLSPYQEMIFKTRYARWNEQTGERETFTESVDRYLEFFREHLKDTCSYAIPKTTEKQIRDAMLDMSITGSMRTLMTAGKALKSAQMANYNCTALPIESVRSFTELMYVLMTGAGVGFSVERRFIEKLPSVPSEFEDATRKIKVEDSREGWARAFAKVIGSLYDGVIPEWDTSGIRAEGARLMTFGGFSSGPKVLEELFAHTVKTFKGAAGRRLSSVECFSVATYTAQIVVAGATRRSATICLFDSDDAAMRHVKGPMSQMYVQGADGSWNPGPNAHYAMANVSAVYEKKPNIMEFMAMWEDLIESNAGEPGIFNREAVWNKMRKHGRTVLDEKGNLLQIISNPCQRGNSPVLTPNGIQKIADIKVGDKVWDGEGFTEVVNHVMTGIKPVYRYETTAGVFEGTEQHRILQGGEKIEIQHADRIDIVSGPTKVETHSAKLIMDGLILGDGGQHQGKVTLCVGEDDQDYHASEVSSILGKRYKNSLVHRGMETSLSAEELPVMVDRVIPDRLMFNRSHGDMCSILRGLFSANGSICGKRVTYKSVSKPMVRQIQTMLSAVGVASYITTNKPTTVTHRNGDYTCKESYDLNIGAVTDRLRFMEHIGFIQDYKNVRLEAACVMKRKPLGGKLSYDIVEKTFLGEEEVYDITVADSKHVYWTGGLLVSNCLEIFLRPYQACNLSTVIIREDDTLETLKRKVELATILGTWQAAVSDFKYLRKTWKKTIDEDRLLGVCLTGFYDHKLLSGTSDESKKWLEEMRDHAVAVNAKHAKILGIPKSAAVTSVKPAGTTSQLCNTASGIHPRRSKYMIRTVRQARNNPITRFLQDQGVPWEVSVQNTNDIVFSFPVKAPDDTTLVSDVSSLDQCKHYLHVNEAWAQHTVSCTINVKSDEDWMDVGAWTFRNFDRITGLSWLPTNDTIYQQAPEQPCTKEEYEAAVAALPDVDWTQLKEYEKEDTTNVSHEMTCIGGACEI